jgi:hypothetical protein
MPHEALLEKARAGDGDARKQLVEIAGLRIARVAMGDSAKDKYDALRELERGEGTAPGLGVLLFGIARGDDDGELRRALELVVRANQRRWGPPERASVAQVIERHGKRLDVGLALNTAEWAAEYPDDIGPIARGIAPALAQAGTEDIERFGWHRGFQDFVIRERASTLVAETWSASPPHAKQVAKALFSAQAAGRPGVVDALDEIWRRANRTIWVRTLAEQTRGNYGMSHREEIVAWSFGRFCRYEDERAAIYEAFASWRDLWIEQRNKLSARERPGGSSAVAHLKLWGGLDIEHLSAVVEEIKRLARDDEWAELVDVTFDLAIGAPQELQRHALAGACRIASEVANRIRNGKASAGVELGGDRVIVRGEALARELRESGAVIDEIVANRADDLELEARLIREKRDREAERERDAAERAAEQARRQAEIEAMKAQAEAAREAADAARRQAEADLRARVTEPAYMPQSIDNEVFFSSLPVSSLFAYARMFRRMSTGGVQSLAADGVSLEMLAVINQTWSSLFSQRPELAMRFSVLISTVPLS